MMMTQEIRAEASPVHSKVSPAKSQDLVAGDPTWPPITAAAGSGTSQHVSGRNKLTLFPLIFLIFFEVAGGPYGTEPAVRAAGPLFARFLGVPLHLGRPGVARHRRAVGGHAGQRRLRRVGRPRVRPARRVPDGHVEVRLRRRRRGRVPGALLRLPRTGGPRRLRRRRRQGRDHRHVQRRADVLELHGAGRRRLVGRGAGARVAVALRRNGRHLRAEDPAAAVGGGDGGRERLEAVPEHAVLEPERLGQREHDGRRGGAAGEDVPLGAGVGRVYGVARVPAAAHGGHRRHRRAAGGMGRRLLRRRCRSDRREVAQVLDRGRRGALLRGPLLRDAEQRGVPPRWHGRPWPHPVPVRRAFARLQHPLGQRRGHRRRRARHVLPELRQHRGGDERPLQPRDGPRARRVRLAPRQAPGAGAALPRAGRHGGGHRDLRGAVGVPGARRGRRRVGGVRSERRVHRGRRRGVLHHGVLQGQGPGMRGVRRWRGA